MITMYETVELRPYCLLICNSGQDDEMPVHWAFTVYTRVQVKFFGRENGLKKLTSTYIRENMRHTYRITKKCQNSLQQAKLQS